MPARAATVAVIGGGVVGCAVAHALARRGVEALVLEAESGLALGASGTNSGILHTGFDSEPGTLETRLILRAAELRERLLDELGVTAVRCGARLSRAHRRASTTPSRRCSRRAGVNGVEVARDSEGSLRIPGESITDPVAFVHALAGAALGGGAEVLLNARVLALRERGGAIELTLADGGTGARRGGGQLRRPVRRRCRGAGRRAAGPDLPAKGRVPRVPPARAAERDHPAGALGARQGRARLPDARRGPRDRRADRARARGQARLDGRARRERADLSSAREASTRRSRAPSSSTPTPACDRPGAAANYVIEPSRTLPRLLHVAAIRSTGLSASLAIGEHVAALLAEHAAIELGAERALPAAPDVPARRGRALVAARAARYHESRAMSAPLLLGIDEGTTAVKAALFDEQLNRFAASRREMPVAHPRRRLGRAGRRADPRRGDRRRRRAARARRRQGGDRRRARPPGRVGARVGGRRTLAHAGDRVAGQAPAGAARRRSTAASVARSRLPLDPYFSAGKLAWLLANDPAVQRARERGTLRLGTVDAYLGERLGGRFATDLSTASRTQLLAAGGRDWDEQLLQVFGLRRAVAAADRTDVRLARRASPRALEPCALALCAQLVDQQAALAGSGAVAPGELKASYGTGVFVLGRSEHDRPTRARCCRPSPGRRPIAAGGIGEVAGALDGGVFAAGSLLEWLAHGLGLAADAPSLVAARRRGARQRRRARAAGARRSRRAVVAAARARRDRRAARRRRRGARRARGARGDRLARRRHRRGLRRARAGRAPARRRRPDRLADAAGAAGRRRRAAGQRRRLRDDRARRRAAGRRRRRRLLERRRRRRAAAAAARA